MSYLFSFNGRINRAKVWLFLLICILVDIVVIGAIAIYGFDWSETVKSFMAAARDVVPGQPPDYSKVMAPRMQGAQSYAAIAAMVVLYLTVLYAGFAIFVKRLHDRNKSAWWLLPYWALPMALHAYMYATAPSFLQAAVGVRTPLGTGAYWIALLINLWVFVEIYCLSGTAGENRFGADPLD